MIKTKVANLDDNNKLAALAIVLESNVGPKTRTLRFFNKSLREKTNNIFVALSNNQMIGLIGWYKDNGDWAGKTLDSIFPYSEDIYWVSYFAVEKKFRHQGVGVQLMKKLLKELKKKNAKELWVYTGRARAFYEKMGFTFVIGATIERKPHDFLKLAL